MNDPRNDRTPGGNGPNEPYGQNQYGQQPGYGGHDQYQQNQYGQQPGYGPGGGSAEGEKHKRTSVILGVIGLFLFGIVLGPLAIWQASKAEALGVRATAGKVLGWIDLVFGVLAIFAVMNGGVPA